MKILIFILYIIFVTNNSNFNDIYIPEDAIKYANKYCSNYNKLYNIYEVKESENINFVSQCLFAGGQSFSGCKGKDQFGMLKSYNYLQKCLKEKGWRESEKRESGFKAGYPFLNKNRQFMLATGFKDGKIIYCSHNEDKCNGEIEDKDLVFYYL